MHNYYLLACLRASLSVCLSFVVIGVVISRILVDVNKTFDGPKYFCYAQIDSFFLLISIYFVFGGGPKKGSCAYFITRFSLTLSFISELVLNSYLRVPFCFILSLYGFSCFVSFALGCIAISSLTTGKGENLSFQ